MRYVKRYVNLEHSACETIKSSTFPRSTVESSLKYRESPSKLRQGGAVGGYPNTMCRAMCFLRLATAGRAQAASTQPKRLVAARSAASSGRWPAAWPSPTANPASRALARCP
eukprot:scaffold48397_cov66-Phaeocystis_antarctica.AAC.3